MHREIQLTALPNLPLAGRIGAGLSRPTNRESLISGLSSIRRPQNMVLYCLVCLMETATIFLSLLLILLPASQLKWAYLTYIFMTFLRSFVFIASSINLVGLTKPLFRLYFLIDNVLLFQIATDITYIFLNYQKNTEYVMGAIICYPILLFSLCGNSRVMLLYCQWQRWQVILYKAIRLAGSTYFLVYGCYILISNNLARDTREIFLLWVFTTCAFWGQMCFQVNSKD